MARILVVEDDDQVRRLIDQILQRAGHDVVSAPDGSDALRLFDREDFDLIITDLIMPEMEGMQTIRELRKKDKSIPLIAMSGGGRMNADDYLDTARIIGADRTFRKPFSRADLLTAVDELLA